MWASWQQGAAEMMAQATARAAAEQRAQDARRIVAERSFLNRSQRRAADRAARESTS